MKGKLLLSEHLYQLEGSQAADQWLQAIDVDWFAIFVQETGQLGIQIQEEQQAPNYHLNPWMLLQSCSLLDTYTVHFQTWE